MRNNKIFSVLFFLITIFVQAQSPKFTEGDVFKLGSVEYDNYKYINFPKANFIIKKGGIANFKNLKGKKVVITAIEEKTNGDRIATIKLADSKWFFNSHKYVTAAIHKAVENKELIVVK